MNLFQSYLSGRTQAVRVGHSFSDFNSIDLGVPQGSVLGPILYLIYVNEAPTISEVFSTCLFCDDTTLIFENKNIDTLIQVSTAGLHEFYNWSSANRLSINSSKTSYMCFSNSSNVSDLPNLELNGVPNERRSSVLFLGVTIDENLKFDLHINNIVTKISKNIGILYKLRQYLPISVLKSIYYSFINSYLSYCPVVFGNAFDTHLKPLEIAQRKCIRVISNELPRAHAEPIFSRLKILKFRDIYKLNLGIIMYKNLDMFLQSRSSHRYGTRSGNNRFNPQFQRLSLTQNQSVMYQAPNNWNTIPESIKEAPSVEVFKKPYKQHLFGCYC